MERQTFAPILGALTGFFAEFNESQRMCERQLRARARRHYCAAGSGVKAGIPTAEKLCAVGEVSMKT